MIILKDLVGVPEKNIKTSLARLNENKVDEENLKDLNLIPLNKPQKTLLEPSCL